MSFKVLNRVKIFLRSYAGFITERISCHVVSSLVIAESSYYYQFHTVSCYFSHMTDYNPYENTNLRSVN